MLLSKSKVNLSRMQIYLRWENKAAEAVVVIVTQISCKLFQRTAKTLFFMKGAVKYNAAK